MEIDINTLEVAALAAKFDGCPNDEQWAAYGKVVRLAEGSEDQVASGCGEEVAAFIAAANPAVVLELVARLRAAEAPRADWDSLTIGHVHGDATLHGSTTEVRAFHMIMREREQTSRQTVIEECIEIAGGNHTADPFGDDTQVNIVAALRALLPTKEVTHAHS
ncbi:hypothetical protein ABIF97_008219 [Bradyrhizobium japonicum]